MAIPCRLRIVVFIKVVEFGKEIRYAFPDDYKKVFLNKYEENNPITEIDPMNLCEAMQDSNLEKWVEALNEDYTQCKTIKFGKLSHYITPEYVFGISAIKIVQLSNQIRTYNLDGIILNASMQLGVLNC
ncbi:hypothetical protein Lal_00021405 [Lupinus albus]|nr:hypothetical protein Lal_00021405 [Lupinus albus]